MARSFNGSSDEIIGSSFIFNGSGAPQSMACWFLTSDNASIGYMSFIGPSTNLSGIFWVGCVNVSTNPIIQIGRFNVAGVLSSTNAYSLTNWNQFVATYDGSNNAAIYLNGVATTSAVGAQSFVNHVNFDIGHQNPVFAARWFSGSMEDLACWQAYLTPSEARQLYSGVRPSAIRPASLVGYWPLDGYNHPALDRSIFNHNGVLTGTAFATGPPLISAAPPVIISALPKQPPPPPPMTLMAQIVT